MFDSCSLSVRIGEGQGEEPWRIAFLSTKMIAALAYLQFHSVKNQLIRRVKRLKQPKYLIGAVAGGLYFYFYFFRFLFGGRGRGGHAAGPGLDLDPLFYQSVGALILFGIVLLAWVIPHKRAALTFTEAEVAFLFPAPIARRGLIHFKLMRSQLAILVTVVFFTLLSSAGGNGGRWLIRAAGWWVILFTLNLHFIGASFALTKLMDRGISNWKRRLTIIGLALAAAGAVAVWAVREIPDLTEESFTSASAALDYFEQLLVSGPLPYLLLPFRLVVQPYLAPDGLAFLAALGPALGLMLLHYVWVVRSDVAFEEASVEASRKFADKIAAARAGNWRGAGGKFKPKRAPFDLRPGSSPVVALLWKNLISAGSAFTMRTWIVVGVSVAVMAYAMRGVGGSANWMGVLGMFAGILAVWTLLVGPQLVRQDLRQDLPNADWLKLFPLRGWQVALGEILAPAVILTAIHWLLLVVAMLCAGPLAHEKLSTAMLLAIGAGAAMLFPALNLISLLIPNAAVLLFPAWFQAGKDAPQGIEATGQRLIFALGQFLAFALSLVPAGASFGVVYFLIARLFDAPVLAIPLAALAATVILGVEAVVGLLLLGRLFERFDLSKEAT